MKNDYIVCVCGDASRAAYLIKGEKNVLFDAGMACSADKMIKNIKRCPVSQKGMAGSCGLWKCLRKEDPGKTVSKKDDA